MTKMIGIRFKLEHNLHDYPSSLKNIKIGTKLIVQTSHGIKYGVVASIREYNKEKNPRALPADAIVRIANPQDLRELETNHKIEEKAYKTCSQLITKHNLKMKLVDVEATLDRRKLLFYFTSDGRVDFRKLVRELATSFRTRIELRQIGVRDQSRILGGLGICGRDFCCAGFLENFHPVSIKMAKEQSLSLNPVKISGACGRLMCCLKYEHDTYKDYKKISPKIGSTVFTPDGKGTIIDGNLLTGFFKVRLESTTDTSLHTYHRDLLQPSKESDPQPHVDSSNKKSIER